MEQETVGVVIHDHRLARRGESSGATSAGRIGRIDTVATVEDVLTDRGRKRLLLGEVPGTSRCVSTFSVGPEVGGSVTLGGRALWRRHVRVVGIAVVGRVVRCRVGAVKVQRPERSEDERP